MYAYLATAAIVLKGSDQATRAMLCLFVVARGLMFGCIFALMRQVECSSMVVLGIVVSLFIGKVFGFQAVIVAQDNMDIYCSAEYKKK